MQPHSPSRWSLVLLASLPLLACGYGHSHGHYDTDDDSLSPVFCGDVAEAIIDADEALEVEPGAGAGVFVEYESGGLYRVTTSCDFDESGSCLWDILVTPHDDAPVLGLSAADLEGSDSVSIKEGSVHLQAVTTSDFDGFTLEVDPGVGIRFDALLDEACGNRFLFWVGDGALRSGAPSNPIDLVPSAE
jgi:hypothetical protein